MKCINKLLGDKKAIHGLIIIQDDRLSSCSSDWTIKIWSTVTYQ